jgi:Acetyl/propionyl-CoA carboxylase, alpha subunit
MPGRVVAVLVQQGMHVRRGTPLLILEAMKMEHTIAAPADGTVQALHYAAGELVEEGAELLVLEQSQER